jgi:hypothetical protein
LVGGNVFSNESPVVFAYEAKLVAMSLSSEQPDTWVGSIRIDGATGATLSSGGNSRAYQTDYNVTIPAGSVISFYCEGTGVRRPNLTGWFEITN